MTGAVSAGFTLRAAVAADIPAVLELVRELAAFESLPGPDDAAGERLAADFARGRFGLWVVEGSGELFAYALHFLTYSTFLARPSLYLEDLYVRPAHRRMGVARALLCALGRHASELGCGRFEWTVLDWNEPAQGFYRQLGAEVLPDWRVCRVSGEALRELGRDGAEVASRREPREV